MNDGTVEGKAEGTVEGTVEELTAAQCVALLASAVVGRIGVVVDGAPYVLPVNYRWVPDEATPFVALRTRSGNVIDRGDPTVAFEIDGVDLRIRAGWSVLVRGSLHHLGHANLSSDILDSHPWLQADRDSWLVIAPTAITGRRVHGADPEWAFHLRGYL